MLQQAYILNEKINFKWSDKKLNEVHTNWTYKIMQFEINEIGDFELNYNDKLEIPFNGKLLSKQRDVYMEGAVMKHCIYTNYWERIKKQNYFVISVKEVANFTVGIRKLGDEFIIDQVYGIRNSPVDQEYKTILNEWIELTDVQKFFLNNEKAITITTHNLPEQRNLVEQVLVHENNNPWFDF